jgi:hypothetical protein
MAKKVAGEYPRKPFQGNMDVRMSIGGQTIDLGNILGEKFTNAIETLTEVKDKLEKIVPQVGFHAGSVDEWKTRKE